LVPLRRVEGGMGLRLPGLPSAARPRFAGLWAAAENCVAIPLESYASALELSFQSFVARGDPGPPPRAPFWRLVTLRAEARRSPTLKKSLKAHSTPPRVATLVSTQNA
jgi:hypothetical protein